MITLIQAVLIGVLAAIIGTLIYIFHYGYALPLASFHGGLMFGGSAFVSALIVGFIFAAFTRQDTEED